MTVVASIVVHGLSSGLVSRSYPATTAGDPGPSPGGEPAGDGPGRVGRTARRWRRR
ncbi:hypothetical protein Ae168Ps1_1225c [Pseudonocardia sp. Ae168_Ps1]|uniref:hypothetical protein n=1 Tax=unclassified Pseudonocardia TaxID=2619320 RepID=UPI00095C2C83|nr:MULTISPECIES: hypothetical protein [unclassified Pseudonocardia]OLL72844.1 hypothetical protein Ae150APs1_1222c [Pseudonocardia sp. Ae150A_Ps1]OLL78819.1 hypothetical protein Ae168Ps1_1225c [Pseudonocardia sp. Ae168_Ps1]OLL87055.1 hypothetical protein Ae263Ps1_4110 [Pseudonocardia sp. Ae263_Ps1]OLL92914.1 hypothetical protein Ae356Ps1_2811c [Pseudonocardia sp. Ae356_Ps1]